jgi:hypothetical protein
MSGPVVRVKYGSSLTGRGIPYDATILLEIKASDLSGWGLEGLHNYINNTLYPHVQPAKDKKK